LEFLQFVRGQVLAEHLEHGDVELDEALGGAFGDGSAGGDGEGAGGQAGQWPTLWSFGRGRAELGEAAAFREYRAGINVQVAGGVDAAADARERHVGADVLNEFDDVVVHADAELRLGRAVV